MQVVWIVLTSDYSTADLLRCDLRHIENDNGRDETHTETGDKSTSNHDNKSSRGCLKDTSNNEDTATHDDCETTSDKVSNITSHDGAEEGTVFC